MLKTRREMFESTDSSEERDGEQQNDDHNIAVTKRQLKTSNDSILVGERGVVVLAEVQNESAQDHGDFIAIESKTARREKALQLKREQEAQAKRDAIAQARKLRDAMKKLDKVVAPAPTKPSLEKNAAVVDAPTPVAVVPTTIPAEPAAPPAPVAPVVTAPPAPAAPVVPAPAAPAAPVEAPVAPAAPQRNPRPPRVKAVKPKAEESWVDPAIVSRGQVVLPQPPVVVTCETGCQTDPVRILPADFEGKETQTYGDYSPKKRQAAKQVPQIPQQPVAWWMRAQESSPPGLAQPYQMHPHHHQAGAYDGRYAAAAPPATLGHYWNSAASSNPFMDSGAGGYWGYSAPPPPPPYSHPRP